MHWLTRFAALSVIATNAHSITCADVDGAYLVSQDATPRYIGFFGSRFATESVMNTYGTYGNPYGVNSVRNPYSSYGSAYSSVSANNQYATRPPVIAKSGQFLAYLTTNNVAISGGFGVTLANIDASCTSLFATSPVGPVALPQLPGYSTPQPPTIPLSNGQVVAPLSGAQDSAYTYTLEVPSGTAQLIVLTLGLQGSTGDVDLYVRRGAQASPSLFDCRSWTADTSAEVCAFDNPAAGTWYITLHGWSAYAGVALAAEYTISNLIGAHNGGIYWNPQRSGEGTQIVYTQVGATPFLGITWYTYDLQGKPLFLVGGAAIDRSKPGPHTIPVAISSGAKFGTAFNPADVVRTNWGSVTLTFSNCDNFSMQYSSTLEGYGTGLIPMSRAAPRAPEVTCPGQ